MNNTISPIGYKPEGICEGGCGKHTGLAFHVHVYGYGKYWGKFYYCPAAIQKDKGRGFGVDICEEEQ